MNFRHQEFGLVLWKLKPPLSLVKGGMSSCVSTNSQHLNCPQVYPSYIWLISALILIGIKTVFPYLFSFYCRYVDDLLSDNYRGQIYLTEHEIKCTNESNISVWKITVFISEHWILTYFFFRPQCLSNTLNACYLCVKIMLCVYVTSL